MIDKFMHGFLNRVYGYDDYTQLEINSKLIQKIDEVIDECNNAFEFVDWLKEQGVPDEVINTLLAWKDDGTMEELINTNIFNSLNTKIENNKLDIENNKLDIESKLNNYKEENNTELNNINNELNEKINSNKQEIDNNLNTINNNLSNYMLKSDLITETGGITLGENIKIAADLDGKQLFTLEKNKEGIIVGNITVSTVNEANDITHGKLLFTLSENYRPSHQIIVPCYCSRSSQPDKIIGAISIYKDGRVLINLFEKSSDGDIYPVESVYINFFIKVS